MALGMALIPLMGFAWCVGLGNTNYRQELDLDNKAIAVMTKCLPPVS